MEWPRTGHNLLFTRIYADIGQAKLWDDWEVREENFVRHTPQIFEKFQGCCQPLSDLVSSNCGMSKIFHRPTGYLPFLPHSFLSSSFLLFFLFFPSHSTNLRGFHILPPLRRGGKKFFAISFVQRMKFLNYYPFQTQTNKQKEKWDLLNPKEEISGVYDEDKVFLSSVFLVHWINTTEGNSYILLWNH